MYKANNLLENFDLKENSTIVQFIAKTDEMAPSTVEELIENSKGEETTLTSNQIQYIYKFNKFSMIIDYDNVWYIDQKIEIIDVETGYLRF